MTLDFWFQVLQDDTAFQSVELEKDVNDFWHVYFFQIVMHKQL